MGGLEVAVTETSLDAVLTKIATTGILALSSLCIFLNMQCRASVRTQIMSTEPAVRSNYSAE